MDFYRENGPSVVAGISLLSPSNSFKMDGYIALLTGQEVPYAKVHQATAAEQDHWRRRRAELAADAQQGLSPEEAMAALRRPGLKWG